MLLGGGGVNRVKAPPPEPERAENLKNWGKMLSFEGPTRKFPYETAFLAYKAICRRPP